MSNLFYICNSFFTIPQNFVYKMKDSQLVVLFNALSKEEIKDLAKWLDSPIHNQRKDVVQLFSFLRKYSHSNSKIKPNIIWSSISPNVPYDNKLLRYTMSYLQQQILDFLAYNHWAKDDLRRNLDLIKSLREHRTHKHFYKYFDLASERIENQNLRDASFFYHSYHLNYEKYEYEISQNRNTAQEFSKFSTQLTLYFVISLLKQRCAVFSHKAMTTKDEDKDIPDDILELLATKYMQTSPVVLLYFSIYNLLKNYDENIYQDVKTNLPLQLIYFPTNEQRDLILLTINFCIRLWNNGRSDFLKEAVDWYQIGLDTKALFENGVLSRFTFKNVIVAAIVMQDFKKAEQFVNIYQPFLEEKFRENTVNYCLSLIYFRQSDYTKAMNLLQKSDFDDVLHNLDARRMLLRIYYDLDEIDALLSHIDSFKVYIKRQKNIGYHGVNYLNLIKYTTKIIKNNKNKKILEKIKSEIIVEKNVAEKDWLLEIC